MIENRLTAGTGNGAGRLGETSEGIKEKKTLIDTDNSMVMSRGKGAEGINGDGRRLDLGWQTRYNIQMMY